MITWRARAHQQCDSVLLLAYQTNRVIPERAGALMLPGAAEDVTAFAAFPVGHWKKIWSTNPLERLNNWNG